MASIGEEKVGSCGGRCRTHDCLLTAQLVPFTTQSPASAVDVRQAGKWELAGVSCASGVGGVQEGCLALYSSRCHSPQCQDLTVEAPRVSAAEVPGVEACLKWSFGI